MNRRRWIERLSNVEFYIFNDLFEGLLRVGKDGEAVPALAQKWEHQGNV